MWRVCRKTIFPRWHVNRQNPVDNKNQNVSSSRVLVISPVTDQKRYSDGSHEERQRANKQDKRCWDDPHFKINSCCILQTAGWVGTAAAVCINIHLKHIWYHDRPLPSSCLFSRSVLAMPKRTTTINNKNGSLLNTTLPIPLAPQRGSPAEKDKVSTDTDILRTIQDLSDEYVAAVQNSIGLDSLRRNERKAFRSFQTAARLGSSQGYYNLGLCYELGKGTRVNHHRAAFCYRKAAMKGHGLASFNLAVYFMKGMGGLPVDTETARLLLSEAATQGVPEARLYIGIELLEEKKWPEAVAIFKGLADENVPEGQYYLGLCYENGWGVQRSEGTANQLFTRSAAQGNAKAAEKLTNNDHERKSGNYSNFTFPVSLHAILRIQGNAKNVSTQTKPEVAEPAAVSVAKRGSIHVSASVPELGASMKMSPQNSLIPSYLNLMTSFFSLRNTTVCKPQTTFTIGDDLTMDISSHLALNRLTSLPLMMKVKI